MKNDKSTIANYLSKALIDNITGKVTEVISNADDVISSSIIVSEYDSCYNDLNTVIYELNKEKYNAHRVPSRNADFKALTVPTMYMIKLKHGNFIHVHSFVNGENKNYSEKMLSVKIYGKNRIKIREKLVKKILNIRNPEVTEIIRPDSLPVEAKTTTFHNIILEESVKKNMITTLYHWYKDVDWYKNHNIPHKIGILLYGKPGTGKSTVARAVSNMFNNAPIIMADGFNMKKTLDYILYFRKKRKGIIIVLIEDFDMMFKKREPESNETQTIAAINDTSEKENQNIMFQMLDGIYSTDETIYIATTNYIDSLDPGMIRYGRFDIQEELTYFDETRTKEYVKYFGYNENILEEIDIKEYPASPAKLQAKLMEYKSNRFLRKE